MSFTEAVVYAKEHGGGSVLLCGEQVLFVEENGVAYDYCGICDFNISGNDFTVTLPESKGTNNSERREPTTCVWRWDYDGFYTLGCGNAFQFTEDGIRENNFKFCPYCGKPIEEVEPEEESVEDE